MTLSEIAIKYVDEKELPNNVFTVDTPFGKKLKEAGHVDGQPWCALFGELCAKEAIPTKFEEFNKLFSASAVQTFRNFENIGYEILSMPEKDSIVVWQKYREGKPIAFNIDDKNENPLGPGHLGIVCKTRGFYFESVEGNTNAKGSREGTIVGVNQHNSQIESHRVTGLKLLGFIKL
jgi:hypothetical protein